MLSLHDFIHLTARYYYRIGLVCLITGFFLVSTEAFAARDTASTGNWGSTGTWNSGALPTNSDTILIPAGVTVTVNGNFGTFTNMKIIIAGTLSFNNGRKLELSSNGTVEILLGGSITGGNGGSDLNIGGTNVYNGGGASLGGYIVCNTVGCAGTPLPVELIDFTLTHNATHIVISWTTASETSNDYFVVEHSSDGENFSLVANVNGAGDANRVNQYSLEDKIVESGAYFYRLSQIDFNGTSDLLGVKSIHVGASEHKFPSFVIFPNPGDGNFNLDIKPCPEGCEILEIEVADITGTVVWKERYANKSAELKLELASQLAKGVYQVSLVTRNGQRITQRLIVQ